jgi:hypothetical protein
MAILTVSKAMASGANAIIEGVVAATGYDYIDRARMLEDMKNLGPECQEWVKGFEGYYPEVWDKYDWSYRGFVAVLQNIMLRYATRDRVIISGLGAGFLLRRIPYALRVFITGSTEDRIRRIQANDELISAETAQWLAEKSDEETSRAEYTIYGRHWGDAKEYDMVIDTSAGPKEQIVGQLKAALERLEAANTEAARAALGLMATAARVKAAIAIDPDFDITTLEVEPREEGLPEYGLVVRGIVRDEEDIEPIKEAARKAAGDLSVEFNLVYRWYPRLGPWQFK